MSSCSSAVVHVFYKFTQNFNAHSKNEIFPLLLLHSQVTWRTNYLENTTAHLKITVFISWAIVSWKFFLCGCIEFANLVFLRKIERLASRVELAHDQTFIRFRDFGFDLENLVE